MYTALDNASIRPVSVCSGRKLQANVEQDWFPWYDGCIPLAGSRMVRDVDFKCATLRQVMELERETVLWAV